MICKAGDLQQQMVKILKIYSAGAPSCSDDDVRAATLLAGCSGACGGCLIEPLHDNQQASSTYSTQAV